jgi:putative FmdB family regulatory protein
VSNRYICQTCGDRFEKLIHSDTNGARIVCPSCASAVLKRAFSTFATSSGRSTAVGMGRPFA